MYDVLFMLFYSPEAFLQFLLSMYFADKLLEYTYFFFPLTINTHYTTFEDKQLFFQV